MKVADSNLHIHKRYYFLYLTLKSHNSSLKTFTTRVESSITNRTTVLAEETLQKHVKAFTSNLNRIMLTILKVTANENNDASITILFYEYFKSKYNVFETDPALF